MMTTAVNALAFRNLSLVCRNGTEAVGRITQSPFISASITPERRTTAHRTVTACRQSTAMPTTTSTATKKRSRKSAGVRFTPETIQESQHQEYERPRAKKRRRFEASDSQNWYSRGELKEIQKSCITSIYTKQENDGSLDRFEPQNKMKRKVARSQAYETIRAVQAFEKATGTKAPPELLSMLLQRYSTARVIEANNAGLRTAVACLTR